MKFLAVAVLGGAVLYFMKSGPTGITGPNWTNVPISYTTTLPDGRTVYCAQNVVSGYTTNIVMIASDFESKYIPTSSTGAVNIPTIFDPTQWSSYGLAAGYTLVNS